MKQAITGVTPSSLAEVTVMMTWPSMGASAFGQMLGRLYAIPLFGKLIALAAIPQALLLYALNLLPWSCLRYRLTNRRLVVERGLRGTLDREVSLDNFDAIELEVLPGQEWYRCGNLIFYKGKIETFRINGVPSPQSFRQTCLKTQRGYVGAKKYATVK
ncbi:MAG: PH domain-containing protein [Planctomycetaceae bacterium]|nr:PH domain-containing protein [Planctomycetaceae bacterium]